MMQDFSLTIDKKKALKVLGYLLCMTTFYILSTARGILSNIHFATVNVMPFLVAAIAFYDGPYMGGCMGVYGGMLLSLSSSTVEGAEALVMACFGILCGTVGVLFMRRFLLSILCCGALFLAVRGAVSAVYYSLFHTIPFTSIFVGYLRILAISLLPGALGYFLIKKIHRRTSEVEY